VFSVKPKDKIFKLFNLHLMKRFIFIGIVVLFGMFSCTNEDLYVGDTTLSPLSSNVAAPSDVPFADEQTLAEIAANPAVISYTIARKLATVKMELSIKESMNWHGARLSEKPVVIYDGKSNAKYYEFIVLDQQDKELGTVTTCAQKESNAVVACILPFVRDYTALITKGGDYKLINGGYPSRLFLGITGKSGEEPSAVIEPETGETVTSIPSGDAQEVITSLSALSDEEKAAYGITNVDEVITEVKQKDAQNKADAEEFWSVIDASVDAINATSDDAITAAVNDSKSTWYSYDEYRIPAFYNSGMYYTRWDGWCGPSAIAWIYRGLYSSYYNGYYLPFYYSFGFKIEKKRETDGSRGYYNYIDTKDDDKDGLQNDLDKDWVTVQSMAIDGGLYAKIADVSGLYSWRWLSPKEGVTFPSGLSDALSSVTNGRYALHGLYFTPHSHIREKNLPSLLVVNGISHYLVAFGSRYEYWNWDIYTKVFGIRITFSRGKTKTGWWALVHDNGSTTKKWGYSPYWRGEALGADLCYQVIKK
jgi:hypothetical protein